MPNLGAPGMTPPVSFRAEDHAYFVDGKQWPGATRILSDLGYYKGRQFYTDNSRDIGGSVHAMRVAVDKYAPGAKSVEEAAAIFTRLEDWLLPYLNGWLQFKADHQFTPALSEFPTCDPELRTCGTLDAAGRMRDEDMVVLDVKCWSAMPVKPQRSAELQLAFYHRMAVRDPKIIEAMARPVDRTPKPRPIPQGEEVKRYVVCLPGPKKRAPYRLYQCDNPDDAVVVASVSRVWWDLYAGGIIKMAGDPKVLDEEQDHPF